ncbi:MAG: response regulator [Pseudomonadota bacterium]|nr:response regulator [Pseudomonadota bacterium]QKK04539.1 MAG: response regulator [Pseudomonadota bacterium]
MAYELDTVKVLVVESSTPLFQLFQGVLRLLGVPEINVFPAYSKQEGFEKFVRGNHDLLIIDWMGVPDQGIQLVREIRTNPRSPNPFVPILMTAGSGHERRVFLSRDNGVSDYLVKPFSAKDLASRIERLIEKPRPFVHFTDEEGNLGYVGPDRRLKEKPFEGYDRRMVMSPTTSAAQQRQQQQN